MDIFAKNLTWVLVEHLIRIVQVGIPVDPLPTLKSKLPTGNLHVSLSPIPGICAHMLPSVQLQKLHDTLVDIGTVDQSDRSIGRLGIQRLHGDELDLGLLGAVGLQDAPDRDPGLGSESDLDAGVYDKLALRPDQHVVLDQVRAVVQRQPLRGQDLEVFEGRLAEPRRGQRPAEEQEQPQGCLHIVCFSTHYICDAFSQVFHISSFVAVIFELPTPEAWK